MELINKTPFPTLMYSAADAHRDEHRIVVMKVSYKIIRKAQDEWGLELIQDGSIPLCLADEFWGEVGQSSVKIESDLAPYKPKCDVIVNGSAHSPNGKEMEAIAVRLKLSVPEKKEQLKEPQAPQALNPNMPLTQTQMQQWKKEQEHYQAALKAQKPPSYQVQLEKTLSVLGESVFKPNVMMPGWKRSSITVFKQQPIRWEYAFGGHHFLKLNEQDSDAFYSNMCYSNPLGMGWVAQDYFEQCEKLNARKKQQVCSHYKTIHAPQIEYHLQRQPKPAIVKQAQIKTEVTAKDLAKLAQKYPYKPAGFGFVGRSWVPRIAYAGTYDQKWLDEQHPYPPLDMNYAYWNGAPEDQQIDFFYPRSRLELWNLTVPEYAKNGYLKVDFLGHRPFIVMHFQEGGAVPFPMITETLLIDTDAMTISLTHKAWIRSDTAPLAYVEAHFSDQAEGELFKFEHTPTE